MDREATAILSALQDQRAHVLGILEGLPSEAMQTSVLPTGWTCVGLVQHLALDVERWWFRQIQAGETIGPEEPGAPESSWQVGADTSPAAVLDLYRHEAALADAILAATPLDTEPAAWPDEIWPDWRLADLRAIALHVIAETACHAGHLDAVRELLDGRTWSPLT
jgi:hypothetical protein